MDSVTGDKSDSWSSLGRLEWRRSSSEGMDILGNCWREEEDFDDGFSSIGGEEAAEAVDTDANCSLRMAISSWESLNSSLIRCISSSRLAFSINSCSRRIFSSSVLVYLASMSTKLEDVTRLLRSKSSAPNSKSLRAVLVCWCSCRSLSSSRCNEVVVVLWVV